MQDYFKRCFEFVDARRERDDVILANIHSESSDFCRFNHAKVRQLASVEQDSMSVDLIRGERQCRLQVELSGDFATDKLRLEAMWQNAQELIGEADPDPYILYNQSSESQVVVEPDRTPSTENVVKTVTDMASGLDYVGIFANGRMASGFASSFGQFNWYEGHSFNLDWSLYHRADKAVKASYAGYEWQDREFAKRLADCENQLLIMQRPAKKLAAGKYHAYLAPAAVGEIIETINWGGFSLKKIRTKQSPLCQLAGGQKSLSDKFTLCENTKSGLAPHFDAKGFARPDVVSLIENGKYIDSLANARSAKEYSLTPNGANEQEMMQSADLAAGSLSQERVLAELESGLFVSNLWYMNFSDRHSCRLTGMTRFATLWVESGEIVAPVEVMRFDDEFYDLFGPKLEDFTRERSVLISSSTYDRRDCASSHLPGALIRDFNFTL